MMKLWICFACVLSTVISSHLPAQEKVAEAIAVEAKTSKTAKSRPLTITVELNSDIKIAGTLVETNVLPMKTSFGEASIPLVEVAGIRFASANDTSTTVVMLNGDTITGATDVKDMTVETEWGTAKINGSSIQSVLFVPDLRWNAGSGLGGKRWTLLDAKQATGAPGFGQSITNQQGVGQPVLPGGQPQGRQPTAPRSNPQLPPGAIIQN